MRLLGACDPSRWEARQEDQGTRLRCVKPDLKTKAKTKLKKESQEIHRQLWIQEILNGAQIFATLVQNLTVKNFFCFFYSKTGYLTLNDNGLQGTLKDKKKNTV